MPAIITGDHLWDLVNNMKIHLDTQKTSWKVSKVYPYPMHAIGVRANVITMTPEGWNPLETQGAYPQIEIEHGLGCRIFYFDRNMRKDLAFKKVYQILSKIGRFLIENPSPNGYGNILVNAQAFGPQVGPLTQIEAEGGPLFGGSIVARIAFDEIHNLN